MEYTYSDGQAERPILPPTAANQQVWVSSNRVPTDGHGTQPLAPAYLGLLLLHGLLECSLTCGHLVVTRVMLDPSHPGRAWPKYPSYQQMQAGQRGFFILICVMSHKEGPSHFL